MPTNEGLDNLEFNRSRLKFQERVIKSGHWQCCPDCEHWNPAKEICKLYDARPPVPVIMVGCEEWQMLIPF